MPFNKGKSKAAVGENIKLLVDEWKQSGAIGTSNPKTKKKAVKQAVAIALTTAGRTRNVHPGKEKK